MPKMTFFNLTDEKREIFLKAAVEAVSYTHLDVYKRQGYVHPASFGIQPEGNPKNAGLHLPPDCVGCFYDNTYSRRFDCESCPESIVHCNSGLYAFWDSCKHNTDAVCLPECNLSDG